MILNDISHSLQSGKAKETSALITKAIKENYSIESILKQGLVPGMAAVRRRLKKNEIFIPDLLVAARAMNIGIKTLRPTLASSITASKGTVIVGTVRGDIRDIEKNLTVIMLEGIGFRVIDLGVGISAERFIETAITEKAQFIVCSATLPTTISQLKSVVQAAAAAGIRDQVKIIVTGAAVTEKYCQIIGADLYAPDSVGVTEVAAAHLDASVQNKDRGSPSKPS
jgi:methanogenic corrinoid protein MtbC1